ncbi:MAG: cation:proton antiporter [Bdellovibrionales bacterium]|nr:cation:proton antiporter [Bdellovibrionales bacterium]
MSIAIIGLASLFFLGHGLSWFFAKTKIPDLLILVIGGYILGPILGILHVSDFGKVGDIVSTLALIVILYEGGLHLSTKDLLSSSLPAAGLAVLGFIFTIIVGVIAVYGIALQPLPIALLVGIGIGSTSSAIVIPMVQYLSLEDKTKTILSLESAFTDVLTIVIFLVVVDGMAQGAFAATDLLIGLGPHTLIAAFWGICSALIWAFIKKRFAQLIPKAFAGEAWALLTYGLLDLSGLNGAIGVLALGFVLANLYLLPDWMKDLLSRDPVSFSDLTLLKEITFLLRTFFFLYLGILIKFSDWKIVAIAFFICILIFASRYIAVLLLYKPNKYKKLDAMVTTAMGPRGLACAVLATLPIQRGIEGGEWIQNLLFAIIPISIVFTALFVSLSESEKFRSRFGRLFNKFSENGESQSEHQILSNT